MVNVREAFRARNGIAFEQQPEHHLRFLDRQIHAIKSVIAGIREHPAALLALIALPVLAFTKSSAVDPTIVASHCESP